MDVPFGDRTPRRALDLRIDRYWNDNTLFQLFKAHDRNIDAQRVSIFPESKCAACGGGDQVYISVTQLLLLLVKIHLDGALDYCIHPIRTALQRGRVTLFYTAGLPACASHLIQAL